MSREDRADDGSDDPRAHGQQTAGMERAFTWIARDPGLIRGVYHYCDEWCAMCPVAARCLAFRCLAVYRKAHGRRDGDPTFRTAGEAVRFSRMLIAAEGGSGSRLDARLAAGGRIRLETGEPLARTAWQYALAVSMWLVFTPDELQRTRIGAAPSPEEVLLWYHLRIYMKVVRAIAADEAGAGRAVAEETSGLGKLTLVCIERSRKALRQMKTRTDPATIVPLEGMLDTLEREIEARFPHARAYVRVGLDVAVG